MSHPVLGEFAAACSFPLDDFQTQGCQEVEDGHGVLVAAPTGAGKTVVGEFAVHLALETGRKAFYTTPIKALSNQKYQDLARRYGPERVGLLTGDTSINGEAPVVVMTTEVLRNMLYAGSRTLAGLGFVVMDEVHYLADRSRGAVWEEVIIHLPESVAVIALSATVSNAEEFGEWLAEVRGETATVVAERRPVPLFQHVMAGRKLLDLFAGSDIDAAAGFVREDAPVNEELLRIARDDWAASRLKDRRSPKGQRRGGQGSRRVGNGRRVWIPGRIDVIDRLERDGMLPAIVFIFSRAGCDAAVQQCLDANLRLTTAAERDEVIAHVESTIGKLPAADLEVLRYDEFLDALSRGVAAHHAGMLPAFKECVEALYLRGLVKVVFATETLALGINMPARTVVLEKLSKWNGETHADITPGEYTQLTGRAGRRGLDIEGHAVVLWQPGMNPKDLAGLASTRTYPLRSSFRPSYNMAVNLVHNYGQHRARELLEQSFAQFQADRAVVGLARRLHKAEEALDGYAEAATCHLGDFMEYAALRQEISDLEKRGSKTRKGGGGQGGKGKRGAADQDTAAAVAKLRRRLKSHPCHACEDREDHARWAERWYRLDKDTKTLSRRIERRTNTVARQFDRVCEVLTALDYLDGDAVTDRGRGLMRIYSELDLVAAEALRTGLWDDLSPAQLVSVLSVLVFESRRPDDTAPRIPGGPVVERIQEMIRLWEDLHRLERDHHLDFLRAPDPGFAWTAYRWAEGDDLDDLLGGTRLTAGDFVRQMKQLVDFTGQIADAAGGSPVRQTARDAIGLIRRGIVAAEQ